MSKELEALERIKNIYEYLVRNYRDLEPKLMICEKEDFAIIEKALKDYERLLKLRKTAEWADEKLQTKNKLKALEIIKEKKVYIHSWYYNDCNKIPYEIYKQSIMAKTISSELLTQDEYDLLKEVLL